MEKCCRSELDTDINMALAHCMLYSIPRATDTHSYYPLVIAFQKQHIYANAPQ